MPAPKRFYPARGFKTTPLIESKKYATGQTFLRGALVVLDANGELTECGADPAAIYGVALEDVASKPGYQMANNPTVVTGRVQEVSVAVASDKSVIFSGRGVNGGTDPVTPTQTMIGESYGVLKSGNDWVIDISDTSNTRVTIVDIDIPEKTFFFKFLTANIQTP